MSDTIQERKDNRLHQDTPASEGGLDELRSLIVGGTDQAVNRIQQRLDDPEHRTGDISQVLPQAVSLSAARDGRLAAALQPLTEDAIRASIKRDRKIFVDVLFPVMGPAIRKAIATTIQGLIQNFNQILEYGFSIKGLRWRLEALRTRRPFGEVVLLHTLVYQVEQIFLVHRESGLLIDHVVAKTAVAQNPDMVSGMLSAIKDFVQDSFGAAQEDTLDTFKVGRREVWIEHGPHAILAIVISGTPSVHLREMMRDALDEVHVHALEALQNFDGDTGSFPQTQPILSGLLQVQFKAKEKKSYGAWIVAGLLLLLAVWGLWHWASRQHRWTQFLDRLNDQPGIVITQVRKRSGQQHIYGLRDPLAPEPAQLLEGTRIFAGSVVFHWEPYQSAYPEYAQKRLTALLNPPASVDLVFDNHILRASGSALRQWMADARRLAGMVPWIDHFDDSDLIEIEERLQKPETVTLTLDRKSLIVTGSASQQWITQARTFAKSLSGIATYNDTQVIDKDQQKWETLTQQINTSVFYFESGRNALAPGQQRKLAQFIQTVKELSQQSRRLHRPVRIQISGHADQTGEETYNLAISRSRAQAFADLLTAEVMDKHFFVVHAAGSREPAQTVTGKRDRSLNRRVAFIVRPIARHGGSR